MKSRDEILVNTTSNR